MEPVWAGKHFTVFREQVTLNDGAKRIFEYVWRIDGTRTIVVDPHNNILLTREFRHELSDFDWRLPGGKLDFVGEDITTAAARELLEETGVTARSWAYLWTTTPDATVRFQRHFLLARDIEIGQQMLGEGESIRVHWFNFNEIKKKALNGEIREEISALSLLRWLDALK